MEKYRLINHKLPERGHMRVLTALSGTQGIFAALREGVKVSPRGTSESAGFASEVTKDTIAEEVQAMDRPEDELKEDRKE